MNKLIINAKLPSLNEYINACRNNRFAGAEFKRSVENIIGISINQAVRKGELKPVEKPCCIWFTWYEATQSRDVDNIQSAQKFVLDALQSYKIIKNDNRKNVKQTYHTVLDDKKTYVVAEIKEEV